MTNIQSLQNLLNSVAEIKKKYDEIARITGENFNVFKVLNVQTREVRMHSALLAELLNSKGSHGMGAIFLELFINYFKEKDQINRNEFYERLNRFYPEGSEAYVELHTGYINEEETEGGRIDIIIKDNAKNAIIIENKIYALDQKNQLLRYNNYSKESPIFYLTLEGKQPSPESKGGLTEGVEFTCISYKDDILNWLIECKKESVNHPLLRETITQYIYLIKQLTSQTMNDKMKQDLADLITGNTEYINSAQEIADAWIECQYKIIKNLEEDIEKIAHELKLEFKIDEGYRLGDVNSGFWFYRKEWCYCVYFYFESRFGDILVGIDNISNENKCPEEIATRLKEHMLDFNIGVIKDYSNWIWVSYFAEWDKTSWADIKKEIPKAITETTNAIIRKLDSFK